MRTTTTTLFCFGLDGRRGRGREKSRLQKSGTERSVPFYSVYSFSRSSTAVPISVIYHLFTCMAQGRYSAGPSRARDPVRRIHYYPVPSSTFQLTGHAAWSRNSAAEEPSDHKKKTRP